MEERHWAGGEDSFDENCLPTWVRGKGNLRKIAVRKLVPNGATRSRNFLQVTRKKKAGGGSMGENVGGRGIGGKSQLDWEV